jgi:hypothetical protein
VRAAIIHAEQITILKQRIISRGVALPWCVASDHDLAVLWLVGLELRALVFGDEEVIDKQLALRADVDGVFGMNEGCEEQGSEE